MSAEVLQFLLLIYVGAVLLNTVASFALWWRLRDPLTRSQLLIWAATLTALGAQTVLVSSVFQRTLGASTVFLVTIAMTNLVVTTGHIRARWGLYLAVFLAGAAASIAAGLTGQSFTLMTLPVLIGVAFPLLSSAGEIVARRWKQASVSVKGLACASIFYGLHVLDFAFLGNGPWAPVGFTVGVLSIFAVSIFAPAVVVETVTAAHARTQVEMEAARHIQLSLVPKEPNARGLDLTCYMKPAEEVGGDYCDVYEFGNRSWIVIGDVTDHGLSSGLVMLMAQSIISSILHTQPSISPSDLLLRTNEILFKNLSRMNEDRTMTIVAICIEDGKKMTLCGCHDNVYIHRSTTNEVEIVPIDHMPLGLGFLDVIEPDMISESQLELAPGDTVFVITDGITEAMRLGDFSKGLFEESRLIEYIVEHPGEPLEELRDGLIDELDEFTNGIYHDDVTFVVARVR